MKRLFQRLILSTVKHPSKINVWGCFSQCNFCCLELLIENLDAKKMVKIYQRGFVKSAKKTFKSYK